MNNLKYPHSRASIKEWVDIYGLPLNVRQKHWREGSYFEVMSVDKSDPRVFNGISHNGLSLARHSIGQEYDYKGGWFVYVPPIEVLPNIGMKEDSVTCQETAMNDIVLNAGESQALMFGIDKLKEDIIQRLRKSHLLLDAVHQEKIEGELFDDAVESFRSRMNVGLDEALSAIASNDLSPNSLRIRCLSLLARVIA